MCFSQNIYKYPKVINDSLVVITHNQLKATNLIFVEHAKLAMLYPIQERKIAVYKQLESEYKLNDSIKSKQIIEHQNTINENIKTINSQSILGEGNIEVTIPDATTAASGAMSAADKTKLDSMSNEWTGTQQEYDALTTKDNNTIYYVTE